MRTMDRVATATVACIGMILVFYSVTHGYTPEASVSGITGAACMLLAGIIHIDAGGW
jgi:hypothetical protein